ncbi:MAG: transcriptional repressor [Dehalococcoidia bacterium]|nr:transcriptional repressor [Dehalococcoidia bacterium]
MRSDLVAVLRRHQLRVTPQRLAILDALMRANDHLAAEDIYSAIAAEHPSVNLSTVYRTLGTFEAHHLVRGADLGLGRVVYHWTGGRRHHHLVCHDCGTVIDCADDDLQPLVERLEARYGFLADLHHQSIFGHCRSCRHDAPADGAEDRHARPYARRCPSDA